MTLQPRPAPRQEHILARGVRAGRDRLLALTRGHPLLTDAALAAVVLALELLFQPVSGALPIALVVVLVVPLVWRRRAPLAVFLVMAVVTLVQLAVTAPTFNPLLVAFYTVAAYETRRGVLLAAAIAEAGVVAFAFSHSDPLRVWALLSGALVVAGFLGYYARTRRAYLAALVDRAARLEREQAQQAQLAAAAERVRIAREVHDIVAHNIAVMIALADGAAYTAEASPAQAVSIMGQVSATGRSALTEMRRLLGVLREPARPGSAPQPTLDDVDELIAAVRAVGLPTRLTVTGEPFPLPPSAQLALYRTIQEALTNTLKHAPGSVAQVRLAYRPGEVELEVTDDGHPGAVDTSPVAEAPAGSRGAGHGLAGMRERAAIFGGQVSAGPRPGGGWRVHTVLRPDPAPADAATAPADAATEDA
jgi:signal transduction histidine kinase